MLLAAFLNLDGERAVLVGGGRVASKRAATLRSAGLRVSVIAPIIEPSLREQDVTVTERPYQAGDLNGARVVVACTDQPDLNDRVTLDALELGLLVNHAGDAQRGNFSFAATGGRGGVQFAVHTGRELPMLAQALRDHFDAALPATLPLDTWSGRRERALTLPARQREDALQGLRRDIREHLGAGL